LLIKKSLRRSRRQWRQWRTIWEKGRRKMRRNCQARRGRWFRSFAGGVEQVGPYGVGGEEKLGGQEDEEGSKRRRRIERGPRGRGLFKIA